MDGDENSPLVSSLMASFSELKDKFTSSIRSIGPGTSSRQYEGNSSNSGSEAASETDRLVIQVSETEGEMRNYGAIGTMELELMENEITERITHVTTKEAQQASSSFPDPSLPLEIHTEVEEHIEIHKFPDRLQVPRISISQDFNFLTVDTSMGHYRANPLEGLMSEPTSPCPVSPAPSFMSSCEFQHQPSKKFSWKRNLKIFILAGLFLGAAGLITATIERSNNFIQITTKNDQPFILPVVVPLVGFYPILAITVKGAFLPELYQNASETDVTIAIEVYDKHAKNGRPSEAVSQLWRIGMVVGESSKTMVESVRKNLINLASLPLDLDGHYVLAIRTDSEEAVPLSVSIRLVGEGVQNGAIYGGLVLIGLYILIIFEILNRTLSAMLAAASAVAILSFLNERPTTEEIVSWLDMETLILLFSMMVMVAIFCETGFFDYSAYLMYKVTNGQVWPLITILNFFTAFVSAFLDNVTTVLLMTPITIKICEVMALNPVPVLISMIIFSNIGGAVTPVGDPPNVIIANNPAVIAAGIDFATFSLHMLLAIIPIIIVAYIQLRITFRSMKSLQFSEPYEVAELRREIEVWLRASDSLSSYSRDESHVRALLQSKIQHLKNKLKARIRTGGQSEELFKSNLVELELSCKIRDWPLLIKSGFVLTTVIIMFFLHSIPQLNLSLGWTALLGAILLLILADRRELEGVFSRVEWSTLIFFSALFIVMEAVSKLGLLNWIGKQAELTITAVHPDSRLTVAIMIILWVSGIASAFIDNIPFTTMMIQIVTGLAERINMPLQPLIWALALGTCLGGNGTLIGASANVVCAGVADQHGHRFTFMEYFKIGFPMTIVSLAVASLYLVICHTWLDWNS